VQVDDILQPKIQSDFEHNRMDDKPWIVHTIDLDVASVRTRKSCPQPEMKINTEFWPSVPTNASQRTTLEPCDELAETNGQKRSHRKA
jgi:hypothetical protein